MQANRPQQARSAKTLEKILDGCDRLLSERTFAGITMQDVAREAGVSVGNLYNRFRDRDAMVADVVERHQRRFLERFTARLNSASRPRELAERLRLLAEILRMEIADLRPVFAMLASRSKPAEEVGGGSKARTDRVVETAVNWLVANTDEPPVPDGIERYRFVVTSMAIQLQFDLLFGTATRQFGAGLIDSLAEQAYDHLTRDVNQKGEPT